MREDIERKLDCGSYEMETLMTGSKCGSELRLSAQIFLHAESIKFSCYVSQIFSRSRLIFSLLRIEGSSYLDIGEASITRATTPNVVPQG